jgi:hypothetical protein
MDVEFKLYKINELKGYKLPPSAQWHQINELFVIWR